MAISVTLFIPHTPEMLGLLQEWPSFRQLWDGRSTLPNKRLWGAPAWACNEGKNLGLEVDRYFHVRDYYLHAYTQSAEDIAFWAESPDQVALMPADLIDPRLARPKVPFYLTEILGEINAPFVNWVKSLAIEASAQVSLFYEHVRGDNPYESAYWGFYYGETKPVLEELRITDHDDRRIVAEILGMRDGSLIRDCRPC